MGLIHQLSQRSRRPCGPRCHWERCLLPTSAADLLSRVPAGSPTPELATCAVSPAVAGLASPLTRERQGVHQTVHDDAGWPLPASPTSGGHAVDAARTCCSHGHHPGRGAWSPKHSPAPALSADHEPGEATTDALCHNLPPSGCPGGLKRARTRFPRAPS